MKKRNLIGSFLAGILLLPAMAMSVTIPDNDSAGYWGGLFGGGQSFSDVIGNASNEFRVDSMEITTSGSVMTVKLVGPYFGTYDAASYSGDLYISSTGWFVKDKSDPAHFSTDTFITPDEKWNYVVAIPGNRYGKNGWETSNFVGVYTLAADSYMMSVPTYTGNGGRSDQAYKGGYGTYVEGVTYSFDNTSLTFTFETTPLNLGDKVGFHWTMYCGNDVVEGEYARVPEPATMVLLGFGLVGLAVRRGRKER